MPVDVEKKAKDSVPLHEIDTQGFLDDEAEEAETEVESGEECNEEDSVHPKPSPAGVLRDQTKAKESKKDAPSKTKRRRVITESDDEAEPETDVKGKEKHHPAAAKVVEGEDKKKKKPTAPKIDAGPIFDLANIHFDLHNTASQNVSVCNIRLTQNVVLTSKMVEAREGNGNLNFEYPAIVFQRRAANDSVFEFKLPLTCCQKLMDGLEIIMRENAKFFGVKK